MTTTVIRHKLDTAMGEVTLKNGYWFYFEDGENKFAVHGSGYSGKETIYVNDQVVSESRNYRTKSLHDFSVGKEQYQVRFHMVSMLRGELVCQLYKNGKLLVEESKAYNTDSTQFNIFKLLGLFVAGAVFGGIAAKLAITLLS